MNFCCFCNYLSISQPATNCNTKKEEEKDDGTDTGPSGHSEHGADGVSAGGNAKAHASLSKREVPRCAHWGGGVDERRLETTAHTTRAPHPPVAPTIGRRQRTGGFAEHCSALRAPSPEGEGNMERRL